MTGQLDLRPATGGRRFVWFVAMWGFLVVLFLWNHWLIQVHGASLAAAKISYGIGFAVFATLMMGAFSRLPLSDYLMAWRMATFVLASLTAVLEIAFHHYPRGLGTLFWASAEVGVSAVVVAARFLPAAPLKAWLRLEEAPATEPAHRVF